MKIIYLKRAALGLLFIASFYACNKTESESEFIADDNTFINFKNWDLEKTYVGPDPLLAEMAHANNDSTVIRNVYFKDGQNPAEGKYPTGTLVVKNSYNPSKSINEFVAMSKRGNGFNPQGNDWEYFVLNADGTIANDNGLPLRGANLMNGLCINCHVVASNHDYIFSK